MRTMEDFEFEALLESVVAERVMTEPPAGLAQRLMARFEQAAAAERIQAARKPFAFAESVKSPRRRRGPALTPPTAEAATTIPLPFQPAISLQQPSGRLFRRRNRQSSRRCLQSSPLW